MISNFRGGLFLGLLQIRKTATLLHDIWNECATKNFLDSNLTHIRLTSLQLLNMQFESSAYGLFPLNWTLLHAVSI